MKNKIIKFCNIAPMVLLICFAVSIVIGYMRYSSTLNSAPFYVWVLVDAIYLVVPAAVLFIVGLILRKGRKE